MFSAASFAPPCAGPHKHATPAAIAANGLVPDDAHSRTVDVDAFCSWSACRMKIRSSARASTSFGLKSSHGVANIIRMKFIAYGSSLRGYMYGWPTEYLYAIATSVGIFAISRIAEMSRWCASCRLIESG